MRTLRSAFLVVALASTLGSAGVARAQAIPFDIEVGYRFLDVIGSEESYRSQINEREGFLVRSIHLGTDGKTTGFPILDHLRIDGSDLGVGPAGSLRLDAGLTGSYRLRLSYRHLDQFSALAGFANPLGAAIGQHTWDRTRNMVDVNLELLPGAVVTPLFGYTSNNLTGPGYTTAFVGQDEFRLSQDLKVHDQEFRAGAGFQRRRDLGRVPPGLAPLPRDREGQPRSGRGLGQQPGHGSRQEREPLLPDALERDRREHPHVVVLPARLRHRRHPARRLLRPRGRERRQHRPGESQRFARRFLSPEPVLHRPDR